MNAPDLRENLTASKVTGDPSPGGVCSEPSLCRGFTRMLIQYTEISYNLREESMLHGRKRFDRLVYACKNVLNQPMKWLVCNASSSGKLPCSFFFFRTIVTGLFSMWNNYALDTDFYRPGSGSTRESQCNEAHIFTEAGHRYRNQPNISQNTFHNPRSRRSRVAGIFCNGNV